uniref:Transcription factor CBF/NF-Y/archaeal histone domain-containing protein n=1 Tax=Glycine max TaxID=3847 RepID=C6T0M9_SOYBN|nr:unknown [Glycine max]
METGGFHGYRKLPNTTAGLKLSVSDMNMRQQVASSDHSAATGEENECTVREQDRFMPIANVIRIMRKILPPHAKISDDAKETIQECVSEYISFITGEANERCQREQRKTITAEDVLWAMSKLGFDDYIEPLTMYLHRYRELEGDRTSMRGEPLGKRTVEYATLGVATAFVPPPYHHHNGYFGAAMPMGTYVREAPPNTASSHHHHHHHHHARGISNAHEPNARSI